MPERPETPGSSRRDFLKLVGAASLAAALPQATTALAQSSPTPPAAAAKPATPAPEAPSEDALALTAMLKRRFKDRLNDAQWESVTRDFDGDLAVGKRLRAIKFANGDEPDSTFKA